MADTFGNPNEGSRPAAVPATEFERSIARTAESDREGAVSKDAASLKQKLDEDVTAVKETVQDVAHKATDKAAEVAERQKSYAADQIGRIAGALERVGEELKSEDAAAIGGYTSQLGASARQFADKVKDKNFSEIAGVAEDFGRRQPLAFLGLAAVAGLAASRFLMASKSSSTATSPNAAPSTDRMEKYNG